ncbi:MAG TPA: DNA polymerase Y family protein [Burkholderiales bacterium]|nr:DNA polymerase Y family protein [Burkholderiales bacterium]
MLWVAFRFPCLPSHALAPIAAWACQFTPKVSLEPPHELLLEVRGSLRLFGGFESLRSKLEEGLGELGFPFSLATAPTARAALWLARGEGEALEALPIEVTGFDSAFFRSIGVATVGALLELPREGLASRCSAAVLADVDRALGAIPEPRAYFAPPPRFEATLELPAPLVQAEGVLFGARRLFAQLEGLLTARHEGIRGFRLILVQETGSTRVDVGLASVTRDAGRLAQVLRERLGKVSLVDPAEALRLEAERFSPLPGASRAMLADPAAEAEDWARLVERLRARLGHAGVCGLAAHPDHRPEHAWRRVEPGEWDPRECSTPGPRPIWLMSVARKLGEHEFVLLAGPERIESGWWDGDDARRDYFVARLPNGALAWVYREEGLGSPNWYLHGLFA